jgi:predicted deacylase
MYSRHRFQLTHLSPLIFVKPRHHHQLTGLIVVHRVLAYLESHLDSLRGRVVIFPSLNPTGHLNMTRFPQFEAADPNRFWPDANPEAAANRAEAASDADDWLAAIVARAAAPKPIERCWTAVFELFRACRPDFHLDLHTICAQSIPFLFLDRVMYDDSGDAARAAEARAAAESLFARTRDLCAAIGLCCALESAAARYIKRELHRSTSGAVLNILRVPAVTIELGGNAPVEPSARDAGVQGVLNALAHAGCCPREIAAPIRCVPTPCALALAASDIAAAGPVDANSGGASEVAFAVSAAAAPLFRHLDYPYVPCAGVVDFLLKPGDCFVVGDTLAVVRAIDGRERARVAAEFDGAVIAWRDGVTRYGGEALGVCAAEDRLPTVVAWASLKKDKEKK